MIDKEVQNVLNKLPEDLKDKLMSKDFLVNSWSKEWHEIAKDYMCELNAARDIGLISKSEHSLVYRKLFHSFGTLGNPDNASDIFKFYIGL